MKRITAWLLLLAAALTLAGCGQKALKEGSLAEIYADMRKENVLPPMIVVDADTAYDFYGIAPADYTESVMYIAEDSMRADEVLLFRAKDDEAAARIKAMLGERLTAKGNEAKSYSPEQYAIIQRGKLIVNGRSLALIVSPDVDKLTSVYGQYAVR